MRRRIILEGNKTEKVKVQITMSDGASASGITVTINGSATTTNANGLAYGEVPYDTTYNVVFSQKNSTYSTPATQSFTANQSDRTVTATYTKYYETCTVTSNVATTITINGNSKSNTKSHSRSIPYGTTYTVKVLATSNTYSASTTSRTFTASQSSRSVEFTYNPNYNGHAYVDLGLPSGTLWATMNVGAWHESVYGDYYNYGFGSKTIQETCTGSSDYYGTEKPLALSADTAAQVWGGSWHMPTSAQCQELVDNCSYSWTTISGREGCKFTSKKDTSKYVFFPAASYYVNCNFKEEYVGHYCCVWSSTPWYNVAAYIMWHDSSTPRVLNNGNRGHGYSVRGVIG